MVIATLAALGLFLVKESDKQTTKSGARAPSNTVDDKLTPGIELDPVGLDPLSDGAKQRVSAGPATTDLPGPEAVAQLIAGRVVDASVDRPIPGATVALRALDGDGWRTIEDATTASDGSFRLPAPTATFQELRVEARARGRGAAHVRVLRGEGPALDVGTLRLGPDYEFRLRVLEPDGSAVAAGVRVFASSPKRLVRVGETDAAGEVVVAPWPRLTPGEEFGRFVAIDPPRFGWSAPLVVPPRDRQRAPIEVRLEQETRAAEVLVLDPEGAPLPGVTVDAWPATDHSMRMIPGGPLEFPSVRSGWVDPGPGVPDFLSCTTNHAGVARFAALPIRDPLVAYELRARLPEGLRGLEGNGAIMGPDVRSEVMRATIKLRHPDRVRLAGRVVDTAGAPVAGGSVECLGSTARTDDAGAFTLEVRRMRDYRLWTEASGFARESHGVDPEAGDDTSAIVLVAQRQAGLRGTVVDQDGRPVAGARVVARKRGEPDRENGEQGTGADGAFAFPTVGPGVWELDVSPVDRRLRWGGGEARVVAGPDEVRVRVVAPPAGIGTLTVAVRSEDDRPFYPKRVKLDPRVRPADGWQRDPAFERSEGLLVARDLHAGEWVLRLEDQVNDVARPLPVVSFTVTESRPDVSLDLVAPPFRTGTLAVRIEGTRGEVGDVEILHCTHPDCDPGGWREYGSEFNEERGVWVSEPLPVGPAVVQFEDGARTAELTCTVAAERETLIALDPIAAGVLRLITEGPVSGREYRLEIQRDGAFDDRDESGTFGVESPRSIEVSLGAGKYDWRLEVPTELGEPELTRVSGTVQIRYGAVSEVRATIERRTP